MQVHSNHLTFRGCDDTCLTEQKTFSVTDRLTRASLYFRNVGSGQSARIQKEFRILTALSAVGFVKPEDITLHNDLMAGYSLAPIQGRSLAEAVCCVSPRELIGILSGLSSSMDVLHRLGYVHCDLSPNNVLIEDRDGRFMPHIIDLEFLVDSGTRKVGEVWGTPGFIAPEITKGEYITSAADVYSFGKIIKLCLRLDCTIQYPKAIHDLAQRCTSEQPDNRPNSMLEVNTELRGIGNALHCCESTMAGPQAAIRPTGLAQRASSFAHWLDENTDPIVVLIGGVPGVGKSSVLHELCATAQLRRHSTIRIRIDEQDQMDAESSVQRIRDFVMELCSISTGTRPYVFIEAPPTMSIDPDTLGSLVSLSTDHSVTIFAEYHGPMPEPGIDGLCSVEIRPLTTRETIGAVAHLYDDSMAKDIIGQSTHLNTGGIPYLVQKQIESRWRFQRYRRHDVDFLSAAAINYWRARFEQLDPNEQEILQNLSVFHDRFSRQMCEPLMTSQFKWNGAIARMTELGWLCPIDDDESQSDLRFRCRSARNAVRTIAGTKRLSDFVGRLLDERRSNMPIRIQEHSVEYLNLCAISPHSLKPPHTVNGSGQPQSLLDRKLRLFSLLQFLRKDTQSATEDEVEIISSIAELYGRLGDTDRQQKWARRGIDTLNGNGANDSTGRSHIESIVQLYHSLGEIDSLDRWLNQLIRSTQTHHHDILQLAFGEKARIHIHRGMPDDAIACLYEARAHGDQGSPSARSQATVENRMGIALGQIGKMDAAIRHFRAAERWIDKTEEWELALRIRGNLAWALQLDCRPHEALRALLTISRECRRRSEMVEYNSSLSNMVTSLVDLGRGFRALGTARVALDLATTLGDPVQKAFANNNLGWVLSMQGHAGEAYMRLTTAVSQWESIGNEPERLRSMLNIAQLFRHAGMYDEAQKTAEQVQLKAVGIGCQSMVQDSMIELLAISVRTRNLEMARACRDRLANGASSKIQASVKTALYISLARASVAVLEGNIPDACQIVTELENNRRITKSSPFNCQLNLITSRLRIAQGDTTGALDAVSSASRIASHSLRVDHEVEALYLRALTAKRAGNSVMGKKILVCAKAITSRMKEELP